MQAARGARQHHKPRMAISPSGHREARRGVAIQGLWGGLPRRLRLLAMTGGGCHGEARMGVVTASSCHGEARRGAAISPIGHRELRRGVAISPSRHREARRGVAIQGLWGRLPRRLRLLAMTGGGCHGEARTGVAIQGLWGGLPRRLRLLAMTGGRCHGEFRRGVAIQRGVRSCLCLASVVLCIFSPCICLQCALESLNTSHTVLAMIMRSRDKHQLRM